MDPGSRQVGRTTCRYKTSKEVQKRPEGNRVGPDSDGGGL